MRKGAFVFGNIRDEIICLFFVDKASVFSAMFIPLITRVGNPSLPSGLRVGARGADVSGRFPHACLAGSSALVPS